LKLLSCHVWMWGPRAPSCIYFCLCFCPLAVYWLATLVVLLIERSLENPLRVTQSFTVFTLSFFAFLSSLAFSYLSTKEVRSEERGILERAGVVQSLTVGVAPIVVVIASVCTFTLHMALGYDLTAAQVFRNGNLKSACSLHVCQMSAKHQILLKSCFLFF